MRVRAHAYVPVCVHAHAHVRYKLFVFGYPGRLIITSVSTVLLRDKNTSQSVYEAVIYNTADFDGRTVDKLYICLSER